ncbi:hypothetical protein ACH5RR_039228 [Cinchona calisaya]|uniref:Uncharacterized protein n=1 Tax=Cinchona calisaya TaxID=153742 RepID=A0ABD2Y0H9_9GENT
MLCHLQHNSGFAPRSINRSVSVSPSLTTVPSGHVLVAIPIIACLATPNLSYTFMGIPILLFFAPYHVSLKGLIYSLMTFASFFYLLGLEFFEGGRHLNVSDLPNCFCL